MTSEQVVDLLENSAMLKLERADKHLTDLKASFERLSDPERTRVVPQFNADFTEVSYHLFFKRPRPSREWHGIIGDALFNLRCVLDHLTYALAVSYHKVLPPPDADVLQFPIADEPKDWKGVKFRIRSLSGDAQDAIKTAQPCFGGNPALSVLGRLNNHDKHVTVSVAASALTRVEWTQFTPKHGSLIEVRANRAPLIEDAPLLIARFSEPNPEYDVQPKFSFEIQLFDGREWRQASKVLAECRDEVARLVDLLKAYL